MLWYEHTILCWKRSTRWSSCSHWTWKPKPRMHSVISSRAKIYLPRTSFLWTNRTEHCGHLKIFLHILRYESTLISIGVHNQERRLRCWQDETFEICSELCGVPVLAERALFYQENSTATLDGHLRLPASWCSDELMKERWHEEKTPPFFLNTSNDRYLL